ncbi:MAG: tetratricopeptide repeat protein [Gemmatimonadaceae bacterium]|nr:tetratricopeptide repeat protein [Gemmatimonadaceae bacterium]NUR18101.1 tetratricopeptide repeat protein [Gemmatimonadaceae bacterium]
MRRSLAALLAVATLCLTASDAGAQKDRKVPKRPPLFEGADTNSWFAYYQAGLQNLRRRPELADADFYWAARLNPTVPEPLYASWVAFWKRQREERFWDYMEGKRFVVEAKDVQAADSLRFMALRRNPMMYQGLWIELFDDPNNGLNMSLDPGIQGMVAYAQGNPRKAAERLGVAVKDKSNRGLRYDRALALFQIAQYDSAAHELQLLLDDMRKRDEKKLVRAYESKQMYEYAIGVLMAMKGDTTAAREAYGRALTEDLSFAPAHLQLSFVADAMGDSATAIQELEQATELDSTDIAAHYQLGTHYLMKGKTEEAKAHLRKAIALEPYYAPPYYPLAYILEYEENNAEAAANYAAFAARAPAADARVAVARQKAEELAKKAAPSGGGQ